MSKFIQDLKELCKQNCDLAGMAQFDSVVEFLNLELNAESWNELRGHGWSKLDVSSSWLYGLLAALSVKQFDFVGEFVKTQNFKVIIQDLDWYLKYLS